MGTHEQLRHLTDGHRSVHLDVHPGSGALIVTGEICRSVDPLRALLAAATIGAGAIALTNRGCVLRYVIAEGRQDEGTIRSIVTYVAEAAQHLRAILAPELGDPNVFHHYGL
jgi:hypothetical protein